MHMPSRKLLEQSQKLDKSWQHIFTASINLDQATSEAIWYSKVTEIIEKQQTSPVWMSESKVMCIFFIFSFCYCEMPILELNNDEKLRAYLFCLLLRNIDLCYYWQNQQ